MGYIRVFLLCLACFCAPGPAAAQSAQRQLKGTVGESVTFPARVAERGFLSYGNSGNIASVAPGKGVSVFGAQFRGRVHWDSRTGHFQITDLSTQDSGEYGVQDIGGDGPVTTIFQLTVYNHVSKPQVSSDTQASAGSCTLLCSVSNGREVTLSWYREGEEKPLNHSSSPDLNTPLTLPLETEGLSHSYSCVATNPVSTERVPVNTEEHCFNHVSKPQVSSDTQASAGSCPFLCSVANGREVTLSWYREGEEKPLNHSSSPDLSTPLTLPLETEGLSHSYSCVASNPVSTERVTVNPGEHCLDRVSRPQMSSKTQVSLLCSFLCSVANGREVTLSWYREGEEKPLKHTSSPDLNTNLTLPLETEGLSHSYSCVATNPVSTERVTVNTEDYCTVYKHSGSTAALALKIAVTAVFSVLTVLAVLTVIHITADLKRLREQLSKVYRSSPAVLSSQSGSSAG
ncbi:Fc receptor-like protein 3 [Amia ocellicauda]|uniref:Fc receptor-like protein 3 n=1 Tax=Amia ocellicauda TaxID=2972642 RepID=UPI003463FE69